MDILLHIVLNALLVVPVLCFVVAIILLVYSKGKNIANIYSAISATLAGLYSFYMLSIALGLIQYYPWLFGWIVPIEYLLSPSIYVYIRYFLYNDNKFRKWDLLFLVPMFIQLVEMFPFLISDAQVKMEAYNILMNGNEFVIPNGNTFFPPEAHLVFKFLEHLILLVILWYKIFKFDKTLQAKQLYKHPSMSIWIRFNALILTLLCIGPIIIVLSTSGFNEFIKIYSIVLPVSTFFTVSSFLFKPWVLYDLPSYYTLYGVDSIQDKIQEEDVTELLETEVNVLNGYSFVLEEETLSAYQDVVLTFIKNNKPYLQPKYSSGDLANDCNIPKHHLSYLLNNKLNMRYNDFINQCRVEHAAEIMKTEDASALTIDAIAVNAGFSSRSTFIKYFQKYKGVYPSDFMKANRNAHVEV